MRDTTAPFKSIRFIIASALILGLLVTGVGVWWANLNLDTQIRNRFEQGADQTKTEVVRRLNQSLYGLNGARGAIASNPGFKRREFRAFVQSRDLATEFPGIRGFGFIERVQRTALAKFIAHEQADGFGDFQVHTSGNASDLYIVKYLEPLANNRTAIGFDNGQDPVRRAAITYAVDTGQPTLLAGIQLVQDVSKSQGLLFFLPVYRDGTDPQTVAQRRRDLLGLLFTPIIASDLLGSVATVTDHLIDFELFDGTQANPGKLIFDADQTLSVPSRDGPAPPRKFVVQTNFEVGSRVLTLRATSSLRFEAAQDRSSLIIIGAGGTLISLLIAISVGLLASGRHRAQALAMSMTAELDRMAQVVQHTANAVTIMDRDMHIVWVNHGFTQITGYSFEEARGKSPTELLSSGKSEQSSIDALIEGAKLGAPCRVELINRTKSGREYWADTEVQPMRDKQGELVGFMEIGTDVTTQKETQSRLESAIRESRALLDTVEIHAIVSITNPAGIIMQANDAFLKISRYSREELVGSNHNIITSGVHSREFWQEFWGTISSGKPWRGEICNRAKDGTLYWVDSMIAPFVGSDGLIEKYISIRTDISSRKEAEKALSLSNALMEESQLVAKVGGWELNVVTGQLYWTLETYRIHETTPQEFNPSVDAGVNYFLPESRARISAALETVIATGKGYDLELETLTTKGRRIDVRTTCTATLEGGKVIKLSGIFQDITDRKAYERTLQLALERAEIATLSKGQFLANMSHEIRTPMNAILGMLSLLQKSGLNTRQLDYVNKSEGAAKTLLSLINDILDFSKAEAGKMALDPQPFRLETMMRNLSVILSGNLTAADVQILYDVDATIPSVLLGDVMRLQQVLINLGGNAVKFTQQGEVIVSLHLLEMRENVATVEFAVRDSGIGIAPENQAHIFTGFSQAEASTTRKFGGTGLGLAISQRLVELMGGKLALQSDLGKGSVFSFCLSMPVVTEIPLELGEPARSAVPAKSVLVVDANHSARVITATAIKSWGWSVECVTSAEAAMTLLNATTENLSQSQVPFDVVYIAWHLPDKDGWAAAASVRQFFSRSQLPQPFIVMLAENRRAALDQRTPEEQQLVNSFLVKPVTPTMLLGAALQGNTGEADGDKVFPGEHSQRRLSGMRILVVEDNLLNQQIAEELLSAEGAEVSLAANGKLGVEAIESAAFDRQFDAVLMDIQMPVMDGYAATRVVRNVLKLLNLPIIAMTANAMESDREDCIAAGMNGHIGKPFDLDHLVQTLLSLADFTPKVIKASGIAHLVSKVDSPKQMPVSGSLDVGAALRRLGGNTSVYARAAKDFLQTLQQQLDEIASQASQGGPSTPLLAHTLKGVAATLGAQSLAQAAADVEQLAKAGESVLRLEPALAHLRHVAEQTRSELDAAIQALPSSDATIVQGSNAAIGSNPEEARAALHKLHELLENNDLGALEHYSNSQALFADAPEELLSALEFALQELNLEAALEACDQLQSAS